MCRPNMNLLSARKTTMTKKYQLLVFALVMTVLGSQAQPNTVDTKEAPQLVDMNNRSLASGDLGVASALSGALGGSKSSITSSDKIVRVERSSSDTQLPQENVLGSASISHTSTSPATSTEYADDCRPRKSLDQASKSTMLTDADISVAMEMCMGINEELFTKLWSSMNLMNILNNSTLPVASPSKKDDHAKGQNSRKVHIRSLTISHDTVGTECARLDLKFLETGMYLVLNSAHGASMYLAAQQKYGTVYVTRLVLNSSLADMTTVLLATSKQWRITGSSRAVTTIKGQHEITISIEDITVTLVRSVIREGVYYYIAVQLKTRGDMAYSGLLGDLLVTKAASLAIGSKPNNLKKLCRPTVIRQQTMAKYKTSFCTFMDFFLDLLEDLAQNLPSTMFE